MEKELNILWLEYEYDFEWEYTVTTTDPRITDIIYEYVKKTNG
jgi:hypothetical protein